LTHRHREEILRM
jgi:hypothetical protein